MLTIKAEVQKDRKRNDGSYNVKIRFTKDRVVKRISSYLFATKADLTSDYKLKEGTIIKQEADRLVLHYRILLTTLHLDLEKYDVNEIVNRLLNKDEAEKPDRRAFMGCLCFPEYAECQKRHCCPAHRSCLHDSF